MTDITRRERSPERSEAVERLRRFMPDASLAIADKMSEIGAHHVDTDRDKIFLARIDAMIGSMVGPYSDEKKFQMLFLLGESDAGKTTLIEHNLLTHAAFQPYPSTDGIEALPLLSLEMPSPSTLRNLAVHGVHKTGYPVRDDMVEGLAWPLFRKRIVYRKTMFIVIDEAQRIAENNDMREVKKVCNTFVNLVQRVEWPVRLILSGVPELERVREMDRQVKNRSTIMKLNPLLGADEKLKGYVKDIVTTHAGLELADFMEGDFASRLEHACAGNLGSIIRMVRYAVHAALIENVQTVSIHHFAKAYAQITGVINAENIFYLKTFKAVPAGQALISSDKKVLEENAKSLTPLRAGERR